MGIALAAVVRFNDCFLCNLASPLKRAGLFYKLFEELTLDPVVTADGGVIVEGVCGCNNLCISSNGSGPSLLRVGEYDAGVRVAQLVSIKLASSIVPRSLQRIVNPL